MSSFSRLSARIRRALSLFSPVSPLPQIRAIFSSQHSLKREFLLLFSKSNVFFVLSLRNRTENAPGGGQGGTLFLPEQKFTPLRPKKVGRLSAKGGQRSARATHRFFANRAKKISPINDQKKCREQPTLFVIHSLRLSARTTSRNHLLRGDSGSEQFHVIASSVK